MRGLKDLWRGALPLEAAFWRYAVLYGLALNVAASALAVVAVLLDRPIVLAVVIHLSPVPYSIVAIVGVWRSADRAGADRGPAAWAKVGVIVWFGFLLLV